MALKALPEVGQTNLVRIEVFRKCNKSDTYTFNLYAAEDRILQLYRDVTDIYYVEVQYGEFMYQLSGDHIVTYKNNNMVKVQTREQIIGEINKLCV